MPERGPQAGDPYCPDLEEDFDEEQGPTAALVIEEVDPEQITTDDGQKGWSVCCDDDVWYDCFWSKRFGMWMYSTGNWTPDDEPDEGD